MGRGARRYVPPGKRGNVKTEEMLDQRKCYNRGNARTEEILEQRKYHTYFLFCVFSSNFSLCSFLFFS